MDDESKSKLQLIAEARALRQELARITGVPDPDSIRADIEESVLERTNSVVAEIDESGTLTFITPSVTKMLGYEPDELLGSNDFSWLYEAERADVARRIRELHRAGEITRSIYRARHKDGHRIWVETVATPRVGPDGSATTTVVSHDVTAWKEARDALRRSEARFAALARNASDLIVEIDAEGRFLYVSPNSSRILGVPCEEAIGRTLAEVGLAQDVHPDDARRLLEGFQNTVAAGEAPGNLVEFRFRHPDETWHWFESRAGTYRLEDGSLRAVVIAREVTERKRAEAELRESEERYRVLSEGSLDMICELDPEGRVTYLSDALEDLLGYRPKELEGTTAFHLVHPDDIDRVVSAFVEGVRTGTRVVLSEPYRVQHRDGSWRWCEGTGLTYQRADGESRFLGVARDVTARIRARSERRRLEQQMQQAQKLEGLGVMAGGIAHDFNNLLTPILGDASLALMDLPADSPARSRLQKIQRAAHRAAALTNQMLAYAGTGPLLVEPLDLSKLVHEMARLLESAVSQKAVLVYELPAGLPPVEADAAQLSQVVMNLITNASEAVGDGTGRIAVRTGITEVETGEPIEAVLGDPLPSGCYVYVEVEDDGCGMDAETRAHIFDPFYTTKFTGRGLGLAAVLGIVRGHKGALEIDSGPDRGTRFRVFFPRAEAALRPEPRETLDAEWTGGSGTLLVVDDDEGVRELAREALVRAGFSVLTAADGTEGVEIYRAHADEIGAVLLDRTMPSGSGEEVFEQIRRIRPDARVLLVSGYSEDRAAGHLAARGLAGFLQKPFVPTVLVQKVRQVLED